MINNKSKNFLALMIIGLLVINTLFISNSAIAADYSQLNISLNDVSTKKIGSGVVYKKYKGINTGGSTVLIHLLEMDMKNSQVEIKPVIAKNGIKSLEKLSSMVKRDGAVAGINGSFFSMGNPYLPIGNLVIDGKNLATSDMFRASLGIMSDKTFKVGYYSPELRFKFAGDKDFIKINRANQSTSKNEIGLYTPEWGKSLKVSADKVLYSFIPNKDGKLFLHEVKGIDIDIPENGYVLVVPETKEEIIRAIYPDKEFILDCLSDPYWNGLQHLWTAGPLLVEAGQPIFEGMQEGFKGSILARNARTAIGITKDGKALAIVVDKKGGSSGITLEELAVLMVKLGAEKAIGLDGGGSSEMYIKGQVANTPSDGRERSLNNGIIVFTGIPVYINGDRIGFEKDPIMEKGRVLVSFRSLLERLGAVVDYNYETGIITANKDGRKVKFKAGDKTAFVNGEKMNLDIPAKQIDGTTFVPLRFMGASLGADVIWTKDKTVIINLKEKVFEEKNEIKK